MVQLRRRSLDAGALDVLPPGHDLTLGFDPRPLPPYTSVATALDGANARQAGEPFYLRLEVLDCPTGASLALPESLLEYPVRLSLPVLDPASAPPLPTTLIASDAQFAWFRALWDADSFAGYLRSETPFDGSSLVFDATLADLSSPRCSCPPSS